MAGDVHHIPTRPLKQHISEQLACHPILQHVQLNSLLVDRGHGMYEPGQRVPLAAQIERRGTNGLAEHTQHPKPLPHRHLSSISRRALLQVFDNEADILQSQWTAINVGEFKRSVAQYSRLWRQRKAY